METKILIRGAAGTRRADELSVICFANSALERQSHAVFVPDDLDRLPFFRAVHHRQLAFPQANSEGEQEHRSVTTCSAPP